MISSSDIYEALFDFPVHLYAKNTSGEFIFCNRKQAVSAGFTDETQMLGKTDFDMPWKREAWQLRAFDKLATENNQTIAVEEAATLNDGSLVRFISYKKPFYQVNKLIGIIGASYPIQLNTANNNIKNLTYIDSRTNKPIALSKKQTICLKLLLEGKSAKDIARETNNSFRTIQHHLDAIREKNNFPTLKALLISVREYCATSG